MHYKKHCRAPAAARAINPYLPNAAGYKDPVCPSSQSRRTLAILGKSIQRGQALAWLSLRRPQEWTGLELKKAHEDRVHEIVVVRNVEADDALVLEVGTKFPRQLRPMRLLHHEDQVGPRKQLARDRS